MKLSAQIAKKYTSRYYKALEKFKHHQADTESTTETAFKDLLYNIALDLNLALVKTVESVNTKSNIIPDGIIKDDYFRIIGYWEAKDTSDKLDDEIYKKLKKGYPRTNTIFEDTVNAVLYQDNVEFHRYELTNEDQLVKLLIQFFNYNEPVYEDFRKAVEKFKENISRLSEDFDLIIKDSKITDPEFKNAVDEFLSICQRSFHKEVTPEDVEDMLIQHLLTERIFRKVFDNPGFNNQNVIAIQLEKLVTVLTKNAFNKSKFFENTNQYYQAIEQEAAKFDDFSEKQGFLNKIYEAFFQSYSKKNADKNGIVYTPQSIVQFMVKFTESVLQNEFGKSLSSEGVNIIDPCTGTGNFIIEILKTINPSELTYKYKNEIFANELMLLPYYIASANIEHFYFDQTKQYLPFENIVFTDTLELIEDPKKKQAQQNFEFYFNEANSERAKRQLSASLFVIIGNPPYNASQENENQNNKNSKNEIIDKKISESYARASRAQLKNKLYDPYVKFFRWASDRVNERNGVVSFITNNSFMSDIQFDGMRQLLFKDFNRIYHLDLGGDVYLNTKLSGSKHNVFGIKVGVGITFLIRNEKYSDHRIFYHRLEEYLTRDEKEIIVSNYKNSYHDIDQIAWIEGYLDSTGKYFFDSSQVELSKEYENYIELYNDQAGGANHIFKNKYPGISTNRNEWVFDFSKAVLEAKMRNTINFFNEEIDRLSRYIESARINKSEKINIDSFVRNDDAQIKWSAGLKQKLKSLKKVAFDKQKIEVSLFRPFIKKFLYHSKVFVDRPSHFSLLHKTENIFIGFSGLGAKKVSTFISKNLPNLDLLEKTQIFPLLDVVEKKTGRYEIQSNITDWAIEIFRNKCSYKKIQVDQIFYYIYGILNHPEFISKYESLLKNSSPKIPLLSDYFAQISQIGLQLSQLHLNYEKLSPTTLKPTKETLLILNAKKKKVNYHVEKMKISRDNIFLHYNKDLVFFLPDEAQGYRVNGRTPVEWIVDQYKDYPAEDNHLILLIEKCITAAIMSKALIDELKTITIT